MLENMSDSLIYWFIECKKKCDHNERSRYRSHEQGNGMDREVRGLATPFADVHAKERSEKRERKLLQS